MYQVETTFGIKDNLTAPLGKIIKQVELLTEGFEGLTKATETFAKTLMEIGEAAKAASTGMSGLNRTMGGFNARVAAITSQSAAAAAGIERIAEAGNLAARSLGSANASMRGFGRVGGGGASGGGSHSGGMGMLGAAGVGGMMGAAFGLPGKLAGSAIGMAVDFTIGKDILKGALGPAMEYQNALNKLSMQGGVDAQTMNLAQTAVAKNATQTPGLNMTQGVDTFRELYSILGPGKQQEAAGMLGTATKLKTVLAAFSEHMPSLRGHESGMFMDVMKMTEQTGHAGSQKDIEQFTSKLVRGLIAGGGLVSPSGFGGAIKNMRSARFGKDDDFLFGPLMFLAQEMSTGKGGGGGSGRGVGPMITAFDSALNKGIMTKTTAAGLQDIGLMSKAAGVALTSSTIHTLIANGAMKGADLIVKNPYEWTQKFFMGSGGGKGTGVLAHENMTKDQFDALDQAAKAKILNKHLSGTTKGFSDLIMSFVISEKVIEKHIQLYNQVGSLEEEYAKAQRSTAIQLQNAGLAWDVFIVKFGMLKPVQDATKLGVDALTGAMGILNGLIDKSPFPKLGAELPKIWENLTNITEKLVAIEDKYHVIEKATDALDSFFATIAKGLGILTQDPNKTADQFVGLFKDPNRDPRLSALPPPKTGGGSIKGRPYFGWQAHTNDPMPASGHFAVPPAPNTPTLDAVLDPLTHMFRASNPALLTPGKDPRHDPRFSAMPTPKSNPRMSNLPPAIKIENHFHGPIDDKAHKKVEETIKKAVNDAYQLQAQNHMMLSLAHDSSSGFSAQQGTMSPMIPTQKYS